MKCTFYCKVVLFFVFFFPKSEDLKWHKLLLSILHGQLVPCILNMCQWYLHRSNAWLFSWTGGVLLFIQSKQGSSMFLCIYFLLLQRVNGKYVCSSTLIFCHFKEVDKFCDTNALIVKSYFFAGKCGIFLGHVVTLIRFCHYTKGWN